MAENATPAKVAATRAYGAEVVQHGSIWDEANARAHALARERGLTFIHPFDDAQLIAGQGTLGLEVVEDADRVDAVVAPIGGGGLISGVATAVKGLSPSTRVVGVESSGAPGMKRSVEQGEVVTLDEVDCVIDGLRVKQVGTLTRRVVSERVDEIVTLPDSQIFDALLWIMSRCKLVVEGAAAAPVAALLAGLVPVERGETVVCVLSGGNIDVDQLRGLSWN
jgi:threonine dehydratase